MTTRVPETLLERVRHSARERNLSVNEYVTRILDAATNPDLADSAAERLRARLEAAGLRVTHPTPAAEPPPDHVIAAARQAAGRGTPLSDLVSANRG